MPARLVASAAAIALCAASIWQIAAPPTPKLIYNKSESAPVGWYVVSKINDFKRDDLVAAFAPKDARALAHKRRYLPHHIPLIKSIWAVGGDKICSENGVVSAPNRQLIYASAKDRSGRAMPTWEGCITLKQDEFFIVSTSVETSFDSRYFGPINRNQIIGVVRYVDAHGRARVERQ